ncbi:class I glutamine amidotransferase-like protein [Annulohypoxylon maeteangense]|uniref:class I glutamine amidotransferase-like protein n=1 Tax=Annulohypoxylon maeteangense TaxID=1927788 RepID=UPI002007AC00|nr:class I glutamine amidotransferase-like protein [Annulohypoxylon maeteangense]KAI0883735.1 class I glutamine amidotransferase-like protein [Annulohypoxylon maeteangense]
MSASPPPTRFAVALYPGFQALDVFGPLDILNLLSKRTPLSLAILAPTLAPVSTRTPVSGHTASQSVVPTHTYADSPSDIEVLLIPGGPGTRDPKYVGEVEDYVRKAFPNLRYLLTVCTGSAIAAHAGVLDGRRATSNKRAWDWATSQGPHVNWVPRARWVADGNIWTSSGISAGIDMMYAFVAEHFGEEVAGDLADVAEYVRNTDPDNDPFAKTDVKEKNGVAK